MDFSVAALLCFLLQSYRHAGAIRLKQAGFPRRLVKLTARNNAIRGSIQETPLEYENPARAAERTDTNHIPNYAKCNAELVARAKENCGGHGCGIIFVGDSLTEHLSGRPSCYRGLDQTAPLPGNLSDFNLSMVIPDNWRPFIIAHDGHKTQHTIRDLERTLPWLKTPKVFMVLIGTNNLWRFGRVIPTTDTARGVEAAVNYIRGAHPKAKVLLHGILPRGGFAWLQRKIDETNGLLQSFGQSHQPGVEYIDCGHVFRKHTDMQDLFYDGLTHPNKLGYIKWFACLKPLLEHAMSESTVYGNLTDRMNTSVCEDA
eukprot:gnl/TRDRNA2_/TRDRNA2_177817_c0_seq22.p1 gnl/TRDRNA2_/TRDRNA2_177817_c0~~gnl/TRDRNA2_/TRDRNA2_177817_c0_seq22.p1  ORF type:complete len:315 (+),score=19.42 gnl/TRDRNA2_/TRDRNA2_177817_c0_seq22:56-1000(+)